MTDSEKREAARQFYQKWVGKGKEDEDDRSYWLDILQRVMGADNATDRIEFQKKVIVDGNTKRIDAYIPETKVIIEQKSLGIALDKKGVQSGGIALTPYEQAKRYNDNLPASEKAKWIVTSNFGEIRVYNMDTKVPEQNVTVIKIADLQSRYSMLDFLLEKKVSNITEEMEVSIAAGEIVGLLYDAFYRQYRQPVSEQDLKDLNVLCVRLVFCLYAEDAGIFGRHNMFHDYLQQFDTLHTRKALKELFEVLDTKPEDRDEYLEEDIAAFPYVNGGLFAREDVVIPQFTDEIRNLLLTKASANFDWSQISPTIFGAVFESTLNPETRRSGGMHYTSIENIHKVIDPLFLDDLREELEQITAIQIERTRKQKLEAYQKKLAKLVFLDPACGSGNFLTETYISLRRLENRTIEQLIMLNKSKRKVRNDEGQLIMGADNVNPVQVSISQFYGIEINDFAVTVAKTALWIAESQMLEETKNVVSMNLEFLPLKTNAYIVEGNALQIDWESVVPKSKLNYIMGNPPFVGARLMSKAQKEDVLAIFGKSWKNAGNLDYVSCWYKKATDFVKYTSVRVALVSTNSVTQGEAVANLWKPLFEEGVHIDFAHRTFRWDSEAAIKAHVHCVIVGFSVAPNLEPKRLFENDTVQIVNNINGYLINAENIFVESRNKPLCNVPEIGIGNKPIDGGNYLFEKAEMEEFIAKEPKSTQYFHLWYGSREFINQCPRYCLWLGDCSPAELRKMPECMKRVQAVRDYRLASPSVGTVKLADKPTHFHVENMPKSDYIIIPRVSSENRKYIPIGFMSKNALTSDSAHIIPDANIFHFGVLTSNVHMAWMSVVCGRLKSDYRYSKDIVYNNFPWPAPTPEQKARIERTAQAILDARALYPDSSLADLYDDLAMPPELRKAHQQNDRAVMQAYDFDIKTTSEADCIARLMKMYQELTNKT